MELFFLVVLVLYTLATFFISKSITKLYLGDRLNLTVSFLKNHDFYVLILLILFIFSLILAFFTKDTALKVAIILIVRFFISQIGCRSGCKSYIKSKKEALEIFKGKEKYEEYKEYVESLTIKKLLKDSESNRKNGTYLKN